MGVKKDILSVSPLLTLTNEELADTMTHTTGKLKIGEKGLVKKEESAPGRLDDQFLPGHKHLNLFGLEEKEKVFLLNAPLLHFCPSVAKR